MQVNLEPNEVAVVIDAMKSFLADLRSEINHTENYDLRQGLKSKQAILTGVVTKLGGSVDDIGLSDVGAKQPPWG
jgi:hypothetical protein